MNDQQLLRYSRQIMLPQLDYQGQQKLLNAKVLVIGLGGLGSPVAIYLAAAGVGELRLNDFDHVDLSNLQRQIVHTTERIGQGKARSAAVTIQQLNPEIKLVTLSERLTPSQLIQQIDEVDLVIDASDNFETRFAINAACVKQKTPLISGAVIRFEGQVTTILPGGPCYRCLYQDDENHEAERCSETGVLAPLPGIIGSIQATEALKQLAAIGEPLQGKLLLMDALTMEWRTLRYQRDPSCPVCN
ncbi:MAG: molybdopterin-synthase adenylyltransferase MoeB [Gammaproteobacteria bacterium]|nr:molybdopterin-synthase adenylyltransferase MoeB [Gammaproteobacteria bacterium]MCF6230178.1 molybdopterin-synthase adenylyltransferase MoeB [Gammaproteobacteria bacterium]